MIRIDVDSLVVTRLPKADEFRCEPEMWQATIRGTEDEWVEAWHPCGTLRVRHVRLREFSVSGHSREDALVALGKLVSDLGAVA